MVTFDDIAENLIAAAIGGGVMFYTRDYLIPLVRGHLRRLPKIDGTVWQRVMDTPGVTSTLTFSQSGSRISATVQRAGETVPRTFEYRGEVSGHQIVMTWHDRSSPEHLIGAMVLSLSSRLNELEGHTVYHRHQDGKVVAVPCKYQRA